MPFPHIVKVFNPLRLIQKLMNMIDKLHVENRKLADENCQLKIQINDLSNKLSREIKKHSKATAIITDFKWQLEGCNWQLESLNSQLEEKEDLIFKLDCQLKKHDQSINDQAKKIATSDKLISDIYYMIRDSKKFDF